MIILAVVAVVVVLGAVGAVILVTSSDGGREAAGQSATGGKAKPAAPPEPSPTGDWRPGQCVTPQVTADKPSSSGKSQEPGKRYRRVACSDATAGAKILKTSSKVSLGFSEPNCPAETDGALSTQAFALNEWSGTACVRNINPPHPGDPGQGGGVMRAGDCVNDPIFIVKEVKCGGSEAWGKILARGRTQAACPAGRTDRALKLSSGAQRILCLAKT